MSDDAAHPTEAWQIEAQLPALRAEHQHALAAALAERLLELREAAAGASHPDALEIVDTLAEDYFQMGRHERAAALLERLVAAREAADPADPVALGAALAQLAKVRRRAGDLGASEALYRRAMASYEAAAERAAALPGQVTALHGFAVLLLDRGELEEAEKVGRAALSAREKLYAKDAPEVAETLGLLGVILRNRDDLDGAETFYRRALAAREEGRGKDHPEMAATLVNLGRLYTEKGQHAEAGPLLVRAQALVEARGGPHDELTAALLDALGQHWNAAGDRARAEDAARRALAIREELLGPTHPEIAVAQNHLGAILAVDEATRPEAEALFRRALAGVAETESPLLVPTLLNLARLRFWEDDDDEAEVLAQRALDLSRARRGGELRVADVLALLSEIDEARGDLDEALEKMAAALEIHGKKPDADRIIADLTRIAELWLEAEEAEHAGDVVKRALDYAVAQRGESHPAVGHLLFLAAKVAMAGEQHAVAARLVGRAVAVLEEAHGRLSPRLQDPLLVLFEANLAAGEHAAAEAAARWKAEIYAATYPPESELRGIGPALLGEVAMKREAYGEALGHYEAGLAVAERAFGPDDPRLGNMLEGAGAAALQAGQLDRAEALTLRLVTLHEETSGPEATILVGPVQRLVEIYMQKKDERAGSWLRRMLPLLERLTQEMRGETARRKAEEGEP
jgi:tetratricopeptide (TPR) repeat protein